MKKFRLSKFNRTVHHWGSIVIAIQVAIVLGTGVLLLLKKDIDWIQPPTKRGEGKAISITFSQILDAARGVPEAGITSWDEVDRLDVRPSKGMVKVRGKNRWEVQVDSRSGDVLLVAYRRSDLIESIHDGSFFHDNAKLWVFLPSAIILIVLWITGLYLFFLPHYLRWKKRRRIAQEAQPGGRAAAEAGD